MSSDLHMWEMLIALMIFSSHFQFYAISLSFSPGIPPLTANSISRKDPIFQWSSSLLLLSTGGSSTRASSFQDSPSPGIFPTNRTTSIYTNTQNGDSVPRFTPTPTGFQLSATSQPPTITINSQSSFIAPSTTPFFIVPTVTSTISIYLNINIPQSTKSSTVNAPIIFVANPSDPNQVVGFKTLQIPESKRAGLPSVTDTDPAALLIPAIFSFSVLLFPGFIIVFPDISLLPSWLSL